MTDMDRLLEIAAHAAQDAGTLLRQKFGSELQIEFKGRKNIVTEADKAAESCIIEVLRKATPDSTILTEESPEMKGTSPLKWIIDPVDGTTNFAHGLPIFSVSIGAEVDGEVVAGIVYNPISGEEFTAKKGQGSFLNGEPIHVSSVDDLEEGLLVTGIPYSVLTTDEDNLDLFAAFCFEGQSVRRLGSAALDFCYVASGRLDGYWELSLYPWDMAAGVLIVQEAGGKVTDLTGNPVDIYGKRHIASNGLIHDAMLQVVRETSQEQ